jgi:pyruvate dehydrogenase E1 component alpha subunit
MYVAMTEAIERARDGGGPSVVEADTMRMLGHAIHDGAEYVPAELLEHWKARDPVAAMRRRLLEGGTVTEDQLVAIDHVAQQKVRDAIATAEAAPLPDPSTLYDGVYA